MNLVKLGKLKLNDKASPKKKFWVYCNSCNIETCDMNYYYAIKNFFEKIKTLFFYSQKKISSFLDV